MKRVRAIILLDNKIVLIKRIKTSESYWVFPGGGIELGETNQEAMIRECKEELGVDVEVDQLLFKSEFNHKVEYFYLCFIRNGILGSGRGPEYQPGHMYDGRHKVIAYPIKDLKKINLKPVEIKNGVIELINKFSEAVKKSSKRFSKISINNRNYFFKVTSLKDYKKELDGYNTLKKFYPVPELLFSMQNKEKSFFIFKYESSNSNNKGLLVDYFAKNKKLDQRYYKIIKLYQKVFFKTVKMDFGKSSDVFFKDRITSRIDKFYNDKFIKSFDRQVIKLNGVEIFLEFKSILRKIKLFFKKSRKTWTIISQCDPNDLNIGLKPIFFDFLAGGRNPLMAEFATFFWYNLAQGNYLSLKYNVKAFIGHKAIFTKLDEVSLKEKEIQHSISNIRKEAILYYVKLILLPILKKIQKNDNFTDCYEEFKNYLAMKMLAVFDVSKMDYKDQVLTIAYLSYFYRSNVRNIKDLNKIFLKIWQ